jgi:hypothetical protein
LSSVEEDDVAWWRESQARFTVVEGGAPREAVHQTENQCGRCLNWTLSHLTWYGKGGRWYLCQPCGAGHDTPINRLSLAELWRVDPERVVINGRETSLLSISKAKPAPTRAAQKRSAKRFW